VVLKTNDLKRLASTRRQAEKWVLTRERQPGRVRQNYSDSGDARDFSYEHSRSRAYRWGETSGGDF
jgi:hypothetical protein